jgi:hypothetical protein
VTVSVVGLPTARLVGFAVRLNEVEFDGPVGVGAAAVLHVTLTSFDVTVCPFAFTTVAS